MAFRGLARERVNRSEGGRVLVLVFEVAGGRVRPGAPVEDGHVVLGERGRGRQEVRIPLPPGSEVERDRVMALPGSQIGSVVLIRDHSGFRGGWELRIAADPAWWDALIALEAVHRPPDGDGALAPGHDEALGSRAFRHCPQCGPVWAPVAAAHPVQPVPDAWIVAQGQCAQGAAGYMGGGPEYLLRLPFGAAVEIVRWGRLYGDPAVLRVDVAQDGRVAVSDPRQAAVSRQAARRLGDALA
jgi:hypothetical protein